MPGEPKIENSNISPPSPDRSQLREFSKYDPEFAKERAKLAAWITEFRKMQKADPAEAAKYRPPAQLVEEFYASVAKEYRDIPLSKEEIEQYFTPEHLASLSLEEYVALMRKVPPRFITHVTRQGYRDHISFHDSGLNEFHTGFESILGTKELRSVLDRYLEGVLTKDSVRNVMENLLKIPANYPTKEEAHSHVHRFLNSSRLNTVRSEATDASALHGAMDMVADEFYGGERGNEIFFVYPTAFVASQCHLADQLLGFAPGLAPSDVEKRSQFNDYWAKLKSTGKGTLPLDASIVFIAENARVSPETGSQYEMSTDGQLIPVTGDTISSQEYWGRYFEQEGSHPSKIIYYSEPTPNEALAAFKEKAGLKEHAEVDLREMFKENLISNTEMHDQMARERELFLEYAEELIEEYYRSSSFQLRTPASFSELAARYGVAFDANKTELERDDFDIKWDQIDTTNLAQVFFEKMSESRVHQSGLPFHSENLPGQKSNYSGKLVFERYPGDSEGVSDSINMELQDPKHNAAVGSFIFDYVPSEKEDRWNMRHRVVRKGYRQKKFGTHMLKIFESILTERSKQSGRPQILELNVAQMDVLWWALKNGFEPADTTERERVQKFLDGASNLVIFDEKNAWYIFEKEKLLDQEGRPRQDVLDKYSEDSYRMKLVKKFEHPNESV